MEPKNFYLKAFNLSRNLTEQQVTSLCNNIIQKEGRRNQVVYHNGKEKYIYLLISGKIKISEINEAGDVVIKELVVPGDLFGDILLNYDSATCECAEIVSDKAVYYCIRQQTLISMMQENYMLTMNYMAKLNEKFKNMETHYVNMVTRDARSRLIYCLKELAKRDGRKSGNKVILKNSLTHMDLANLISASRQTVTVILNELKEAGDLSYNRREMGLSELLLAS